MKEALAFILLFYSIVATVPYNDLCEDAALISTGNYQDTITGASKDAQDCITQSTSPDVWYKFNSGSSTYLRLSFCGLNGFGGSANFNSKIFVYTGTCSMLTCYFGNDDHECSGTA